VRHANRAGTAKSKLYIMRLTFHLSYNLSASTIEDGRGEYEL